MHNFFSSQQPELAVSNSDSSNNKHWQEQHHKTANYKTLWTDREEQAQHNVTHVIQSNHANKPANGGDVSVRQTEQCEESVDFV